MKKPYCLGYDSKSDSFNHYVLIYLPALILTVLFHISSSQEHYYFEYFWSFSIWLEALAIIPQLYIVYKQKRVEVITGTYMACLGCYKLFYVLNWIYLLLNEEKLIWMKFVAGVIQVAIYFDFLYYYFIAAKVTNNSIKLQI
jgi:ER lumen protein retaining receptor